MLNYWITACRVCPPFVLTHTRRRMHHCLTIVSITCWSSITVTSHWRRHYTVKAVRGLWKFWWHFTAHYFPLWPRNFCARKPHIHWDMQLKAIGVALIMEHRVYYRAWKLENDAGPWYDSVIKFLRQGIRKLSSDRHTDITADTTEIIYHAASRVVKIT